MLSRSDAALFVLKQFGGSIKQPHFFYKCCQDFSAIRLTTWLRGADTASSAASETCPLPGAQDQEYDFLDLYGFLRNSGMVRSPGEAAIQHRSKQTLQISRPALQLKHRRRYVQQFVQVWPSRVHFQFAVRSVGPFVLRLVRNTIQLRFSSGSFR